MRKSNRERVTAILAAAGVLLLLALPTAASLPILTSMPTVNSSTVVTDNATQYSVTTTVSDASGYDDIRAVRTLFDYTESGGDQSKGRGYLSWGKTDYDITQYGGTWTLADATGGGRWAYRTDAWGSTTYITPVGCTMSTAGLATGGTGSRTVTWTFKAKSAWAFNPLMNDADAWAADYATNTGWLDTPTGFDVVSAPCNAYCATPQPPIVSNPTGMTLDVAINPADSASDLFAIMISPGMGGQIYVQNDGTLGPAAVFNSRSTWGTKRVQGLLWNTTYTFSARAARYLAGYCPSGWGPGTQATTLDNPPRIDCRQGTPFSTWIRGQCPYRSISLSGYDPLWNLTVGANGRGLAGGLDADCYDWRDIDSGSGWGTPTTSGRFTTLEFLQYARDHDAAPMITANAFGGGYRDWTRNGVFVCQTVNPDGLAADWVRFTNFILQSYRQGDEASLTGEDLRIYNSIVNWGDKPKLLAPGEGSVPGVYYWEIGNEPELGGYGDFLTDHYLSPTDYRDRYKLISQAMQTIDPTLKFGPCLMTPTDPNSGSGLWVTALAADPAVQFDFIGYHPYTNMKVAWGNASALTEQLRIMKSTHATLVAGIQSILAPYGRTNVELVASEWNPMNWDATSTQQRSMAQALGIAETCFTFAEEDLLAANYWEQPQNYLGATNAFQGLRDHMGNVLVTNLSQMGLQPGNLNWRLYVTKNDGDDSTLMIWGLNFNEDEVVSVNLALGPCRVQSATLRRYGLSTGNTSLMTSNGMTWSQQDLTAGFDPDHFTFTMADAQISILVLQLIPSAPVDFDRDGDVDLSDFGHFQKCLSGPGVAQNAYDCAYARLDNDSDVDEYDMQRFMNCLAGPDTPAAENCAD